MVINKYYVSFFTRKFKVIRLKTVKRAMFISDTVHIREEGESGERTQTRADKTAKDVWIFLFSVIYERDLSP